MPFDPLTAAPPRSAADEPWTVRRAAAEDAERLSLVGRATFLESYTWALPGDDILAHCRERHAEAYYADWLAAGPALWLAEVAGGAPVGYSGLAAPDLPQAAPGDLELKRIYVLSRFHGPAGPARALMEAAAAEARRLGAPRLLVGLHPRNARAQAFYRRSGFAPIGARVFTVGATVVPDDVVMALELSSSERLIDV